MKRILSGIQSSGSPHLGNYLGAMKRHILMQETHESFIFIADLHALTTVKDKSKMREMTLEVALDYLALGLNPEKTVFFRNSDVAEHSELAWILSCQAPMGLLERAHAWKDAIAKKQKDPTVGLFTYPILMAADILLYHPDLVPVGKDQKQHVEIARDLAEKFNNTYGKTFKLPEPEIPQDIASIIGTDGEHKMSKSYGNTINIFADEANLKKQVSSIKTNSTAYELPKDPNECTVFKYYSFLASPQEISDLEKKYQAGNFGYGDAKQILYEKLLEYFSAHRQKRIELLKNLSYVEDVLRNGAIKARKVASQTLAEVKQKIGLQLTE
jgi:tryptophanyl-tRNA synthetase